MSRVLLESVHLDRLWTSWGPTDEAVALHRASGGRLSSDEHLMFEAVWDLWERASSGGRLFAIVDALDPPLAALLCALLIACKGGHRAVDRWIEDPSARSSHLFGARYRGATCSSS